MQTKKNFSFLFNLKCVKTGKVSRSIDLIFSEFKMQLRYINIPLLRPLDLIRCSIAVPVHRRQWFFYEVRGGFFILCYHARHLQQIHRYENLLDVWFGNLQEPKVQPSVNIQYDCIDDSNLECDTTFQVWSILIQYDSKEFEYFHFLANEIIFYVPYFL